VRESDQPLLDRCNHGGDGVQSRGPCPDEVQEALVLGRGGQKGVQNDLQKTVRGLRIPKRLLRLIHIRRGRL
jgi:hypothetical protein